MLSNRREFLKFTGFVVGGITGGTALLIWINVNSPLLKLGPNVSEQHLIIDPNSNQFMYRDGYIVKVEK